MNALDGEEDAGEDEDEGGEGDEERADAVYVLWHDALHVAEVNGS